MKQVKDRRVVETFPLILYGKYFSLYGHSDAHSSLTDGEVKYCRIITSRVVPISKHVRPFRNLTKYELCVGNKIISSHTQG